MPLKHELYKFYYQFAINTDKHTYIIYSDQAQLVEYGMKAHRAKCIHTN